MAELGSNPFLLLPSPILKADVHRRTEVKRWSTVGWRKMLRKSRLELFKDQPLLFLSFYFLILNSVLIMKKIKSNKHC